MSDGRSDDGGSYDNDGDESNRSPVVDAIFGILKRLERSRFDTFTGPSSLKLGLYWEALQPLGMVLNPYVGYSPWVLQKPFYWVFLLAFLWDENESGFGPLPSRIIFWTIAATLVVLILMIVTNTGLGREKSANVIRSVAHASVSLLYLPLQHLFLARMVCSSGPPQAEPQHLWLVHGEECFTTLHIIETVAAALSFVALACLSLAMTTTLFEINTASFHPQARASSSVDILIWAHRTLSAVAFHTLMARRMSQEYCVVFSLTSFSLLMFLLIKLPYFRVRTLQLKSCVYFITFTVSLIGVFHENDASSHPKPSNTLLGFAIAVSLLGIPVTWFWLIWFRVSPSCLRAFNAVLSGKRLRMERGQFPKHLPDNDQLVSKYEDLEGWLLEMETSMTPMPSSGQPPKSDVIVPYVDAVYFASDVELSTRYLHLWRNKIGTRPSDRMLAMASRIYTKGLLKYPGDRDVNVHFAAFLVQYLERSHVAISVITGLENSQQSPHFQFISQYTIFKMANKLRTDLGIRDKAHCQALEQARSHHKEALGLMHDFWMKVGVKTDGGLKTLAGLANQITEKRETAKVTFQWMLSQHPHDTQILMQYAQFLQQVMLDEAAYDRCLEEIEKIQQKRASHNRTQTSGTSRANNDRSFIVEESRNEDEFTRRGSKTVQMLQLTIRVAFLPLLVLLAVQFVMYYLYMDGHVVLIDQTYSAGQVRYLSQRAGVTLQNLVQTASLDESQQVGQSTPQLDAMTANLRGVTSAFLAHHNRITHGESAVTYDPHRKLMKTANTNLNYYATSTSPATPQIVTPWELGLLIGSALELLMNQAVSLIPSHKYTRFLLGNLAEPISRTFNMSASLPQEKSGEILNTALILTILLSVLSLVVVFLIYLMFVWNFNKIATSKITTLDLFMLIPDTTLRTTAEEARKKLILFEEDEDELIIETIVDRSQVSHKLAVDTGELPADELPRRQSGDSQDESGRRLSMTDAEAIESLIARRESAVAIVLKRGLADMADLNKEGQKPIGRVGSMRNDSGKDLTRSNLAVSTSSAVGLSEVSELPQETEVVEDKELEGPKKDVEEEEEPDQQEPLVMPPVVKFAVVVIMLCVSVACAVDIFLVEFGDLEDRYGDRLRAFELVTEYDHQVAVAVRSCRRFTESGDMQHYRGYWDVLENDKLGALEAALYTLSLTDAEVVVLSKFGADLISMNMRLLASLTLTAQYFTPPLSVLENTDGHLFSEVSGMRWGPESIPRHVLADTIGNPILPGVYRHSNYVQDTMLPNKNTPEIGVIISKHVSDSYMIGTALCLHLLFDAAATGDHWTNYRATVLKVAAAWLRDGERLVRRSSLIPATPFSEMKPSIEELADPSGAGFVQYRSSEFNLEGFITRLRSYATAIATSIVEGLLPLPGQLEVNGIDIEAYAAERSKWNMTLQLSWGQARTGLETAMHSVVFTSVSASSLRVILQQQKALLAGLTADLARDVNHTTLGASLQQMGRISDAQGYDTSRQLAEVLFTTTYNISDIPRWQERANAMLAVPDEGVPVNGTQEHHSQVQTQLSHIMQLKKSISRSVANDDLFEYYTMHFKKSLAKFSSLIQARLLEDSVEAKDKLYTSLQVALYLSLAILAVAIVYFAALVTACAYGAPSGLTGLARDSAWLVMVVALTTSNVALICIAMNGADRMDARNAALVEINEAFNATSSVITELRDTSFRFTQYRSERLLVHYFGILQGGGLYDSLQRLVDHTLLAPSALSGNKDVLARQARAARKLMQESEVARWLERIALRLSFSRGPIGGNPGQHGPGFNASLSASTSEDHSVPEALNAPNAGPGLQAVHAEAGQGSEGESGDGVTGHAAATFDALYPVKMHVGEVPPAIQTQEWDIVLEEDYVHNLIEYSPDFANHASYYATGIDIGQPDRAPGILLGGRFLNLTDTLAELPGRMAEEARQTWDAEYDDIDRETLCGVEVAQVLSLVQIALMLVVALHFTFQSLDSRQGSTDAETENGLRDHFRLLTKRCRIALFCVSLFLVALFAVMYVTQDQTESEVKMMNLVTSTEWLATQGLLLANQISANPAVFIVGTQVKIEGLTAAMRSLRDEVYLSELGADLDRSLLFEGAYTDTGTIDTCRSGQTYSPAPISIDVRLLNYIVLLENIARAGRGSVSVGKAGEASGVAAMSSAAQTRQTSIVQVQILRERLDPLLEGLHQVVDKYKTDAANRAQTSTIYVVLVAAATLLLIVLEYQFVFLPMLVQLTEEENGTRLMLNMIPLDVREAVPEIAQYFSTGKVDEDEKMKKLLQQSEKLLQNILPPIISRRLKAGESLIADDHAKVTVSFSALVGFDTYSKTMSAKEIVSFLNDLYSKFDSLTDKLDLEKIKTIGDTYFMCGGLTEVTRDDHALRIVETVLQFFETLAEHKEKYNTPDLVMKAGVNSGPAVAGVIGSKKVAYDLWGDAVNVSSRLCGSCLPGRIALFSTTYEEVKEYYHFTARQVQAKGKGLITTYILDSRIKPTPYTYLFGGNVNNVEEDLMASGMSP